jgi:choline monooxygenase
MDFKEQAPPVRKLIESYDARALLAEARTPPASWYLDQRILELERGSVFVRSWQMAGRAEQVTEPGQFIASEIAGEPIVVVRGSDRVLRGFFNVCRHHAAAVMSKPHGSCQVLRCPYHGWTYNLQGELIGTPDFSGVLDFDRTANGLVPVEVGLWESWVFVKLERGGRTLEDFLGDTLRERVRALRLETLTWLERRRYTLECNWKVFVDNYLDGGYHVPHVHTALNGVLDYNEYRVENGERYCVQSSPMVSNSEDVHTSAVRRGASAFYCWIYPNVMINCYEGALDINLVCPLSVDRTEVVFDYYFADVSPGRAESNRASISVSERIQDEDAAICNAVQRGLRSRAYDAGRLSVRREAGEHLFHGLLHADLRRAIDSEDTRTIGE